jgi:hypothetical protein
MSSKKDYFSIFCWQRKCYQYFFYYLKEEENMKKSFFLIVCLVLVTSLSVYGFEKCTKGVGGTLSFNVDKLSDDLGNRYTFSITPQLSYFVFDNFSVDAQVLVGTTWGGYSSTATDLGFGLGARYFFKQFYGGLLYTYSGARVRGNIVIEGDMVYEGINWQRKKDLTFRAGRLFGIVKHVYLDFGLFYKIGIGKVTNSNPTFVQSFDNDKSQFGTSLGFSILF